MKIHDMNKVPKGAVNLINNSSLVIYYLIIIICIIIITYLIYKVFSKDDSKSLNNSKELEKTELSVDKAPKVMKSKDRLLMGLSFGITLIFVNPVIIIIIFRNALLRALTTDSIYCVILGLSSICATVVMLRILKIHFFSLKLTEDKMIYRFIFKKMKKYSEVHAIYWQDYFAKGGKYEVLRIEFKDKSRIRFCIDRLEQKDKDYIIATLPGKTKMSFNCSKPFRIFN